VTSSATTVQQHFRFRTDATAAQGGTATWGAAVDTNYNPPVDAPFRLRFTVANTGSAATASAAWSIRYSRNGGTYTAITTATTVVKAVDGSGGNSADNSAITSNLLTAGTGTFANGQYDDTGASAVQVLTNGFYTEFEFGLQINSVDLLPGDTLDFRVYFNAAVLNTYSVTPRVVIPLKGAQYDNPLRPRWLTVRTEDAAFALLNTTPTVNVPRGVSVTRFAPKDVRVAVNTGTAGLDLELLGQDRFYGAPGEVPAHQNANPLRAKPPTLRFDDTAFALANTSGTTTVYVPRAPQTWRAQARDSRAAVLAGAGRSWVIAFGGTPAPAATPAVVQSTALPVRARAVQQPTVGPNWLSFYGAAVAASYITRDALITRIPRRPFPIAGLSITDTTLGGKDIFYGEMGQVPTHRWPNPHRPQFRMPDAGQGASPALLTAPAAPPFKPVDMPNPVRARRVDQPLTAGTRLGLNADALPQVATHQALPVRARTVTFGFIQAQFAGLQPPIFATRPQPNPLRSRPPTHDAGANLTLGLPLPTLPVGGRAADPNPLIRRQGLSFTATRFLGLREPAALPFNTFSGENPLRPRVRLYPPGEGSRLALNSNHGHENDGDDCREVTWLDGAGETAAWLDGSASDATWASDSASSAAWENDC
jgi:hypothetical protein